MPTPLSETERLPDADRRALLTQYSAAYDRAQDAYDTSVRTLSAGGVAVSASLASAYHHVSNSGIAALSAFGLSLAANVLSYLVAQQDIQKRHQRVSKGEWAGATRLAKWTTGFNYLAGAALILGAALLGLFISTR